VPSNQVVSSDQLAKMKFTTLALGGKFGKLLGQPYKPFYLMIYGQRFHGKSSVAMLLADALASKNMKVLYVSNEEGVKGSLQEKLLRLQISAPIHFVEDYNHNQFKGYDSVFLDSTQTVGMKPDEFKALKRQYPNTSFILVFKANRDGTSKGGSDWEHDVDAIMHIENQTATMEKNRFPNGSYETIKIF
jgi:predicted ATP-dependent serine protease